MHYNIVSSENYCTREYWKITVSCGRKTSVNVGLGVSSPPVSDR